MRFLISIVFFLFSTQAFSQGLMEERLFQLSGHQDLKSFLLKKPQKKEDYFRLNISGLINKDIPSTLENLTSDDEEVITNFLSKNFGQPQYGLTKNALIINVYNFSQEFSLSGGISAKAQNPIIPELSGVYVEDLSGSSSYQFQALNLSWTPKLTYGKRKYKYFFYTTGDFLEDAPKFELQNIEAQNFMEASLLLESQNFFLNMQSIPISGFFPQDYWEVRLGGHYQFSSYFTVYGSLAPFYASQASWERLVVSGLTLTPISWVDLDLFYQNSELGASAKIDLSLLSIEAYYLTQRFDDYNTYKKDQIGLQLSIKY